MRPRVVIAEDFVLIQESIRNLLEPDYEVVAAVEDGCSALEAVVTHHPDILLMDASLPGLNGFAIAEELASMSPELKIVFVTAHANPAYVERAFQIGAKGYLLKGSIRVELLIALRQVLAGGEYRSALLQ